MRDYSKQAKIALRVYLERGREAHERLIQRDFEEAARILKARNAAFHNFRAVDALARKNGSDVGRDTEALAIWDEIKKIDELLEKKIFEVQVFLKKELNHTRKLRQHIKKYKSGQNYCSEFERAV